MKKTFGILAFPAGHSLSPLMQNAAFAATQTDAEFVRFEIPPRDLSHFFQKVREKKISGLAVSIPHKERIAPLVDNISERAQKIGAINTVFWRGDKLCGENTDAEGFWKALEKKLSPGVSRAAVIGAGGAARAMVFALREKGFLVSIFNRTMEKARLLAAEFSTDFGGNEDFHAADFDLVANATSAGLRNPEESPVETKTWKGFCGVAFDAVFDPKMTKFLCDAQDAGASIVSGDKMLLYQGTLQFELWTGKSAPIREMEKALESV